MSTNNLASASARPRAPSGRRLYRLADGLAILLMAAALRRTPAGRLHLTLPSGRSAVLGPTDLAVAADLTLTSYRVLWKSLRRGVLGFADSYMSGDVETSSLERLFSYYIDNERALVAAGRGLFRTDWRDRLLHSRRANTRTGSRRNIAAHYDLGNAFYRLWLDAGLTYSSGIHASPDSTLEQAQEEKYRRILAALDLSGQERVLEIGCGWGGFTVVAAPHVASITGITISAQQHVAARQRISSAGLSQRVDIRFEDYRDSTGTFDRIASIEMIEAVGEENWSTYFETIARRLAPGGKAVIQAITIRPDLYEPYRRNPDFIQRYIFPGGMLPTEEAMQRHGAAAGLGYERLETFGASYALTLAEWQRRFVEAWPRVAALGFDERFRRMWLYYLAYCQVGFERGMIDVGLYRFTKSCTDDQSSRRDAT